MTLRTLSRAVALAALLVVSGATARAQETTPPAPVQPAQPYEAPPLTDEDRRAAFPDVGGHATQDDAVHALVLFDRLEWQSVAGASGVRWDNQTWAGRDRDRLWIRSEGRSASGVLEEADVHVLYGRMFSRWWDVVGGIRQDFEPGAVRTWGAFGIQGLAPYWFEVEATGYVGQGGADRRPVRRRLRTPVHPASHPAAAHRTQSLRKVRARTRAGCGTQQRGAWFAPALRDSPRVGAISGGGVGAKVWWHG